MLHRLAGLFCVLWLLLGLPRVGCAGQLVSSVHPLHLIAQAVTAGIEQPVLLLPAGQDGHHIQLAPRQVQALRQADLVLWVGPALEAPLASRLAAHPHALRVTGLRGLHLLPLRDATGQPIANSIDPHLWLDPVNAIGIAHAIAAYRGVQRPQDAARYRANAEAFTRNLLASSSPPVPTRRYWAWHDAYQYLEKSQNLHFLGALTPDPNLAPTLSRLQQASQTSRPTCLLTDRPLPASLTQRLPSLQPRQLLDTLNDASGYVAGWDGLRRALQRCP